MDTRNCREALRSRGCLHSAGSPVGLDVVWAGGGMRLGALAWGAAALALGSRRLGVVVSGTGLCGGMGKAPHSGRDLVRCHHNQGTEKQGWIREFFCKNK